MQEFDDRHEVLERARETLRRLEARDRERRLERQMRGPVDELERDVQLPPADYRGCRSTREMTARQFNSWCDAGRPALTSANRKHVSVLKSQADALISAAIAGERAHVAERLEGFASVLGAECGAIEKRLRADIAELRADERGIEALDLPADWRHHATH